MNVGIVGSRTFTNKQAVIALVHRLSLDDVVVSGGCKNSPDAWAAEAARKRGLKVIEHLADWNKFGKSAGFKRNPLIVRDSDIIHAFRAEGTSNGTDHTIRLAKKKGIPVYVWTEGEAA